METLVLTRVEQLILRGATYGLRPSEIGHSLGLTQSEVGHQIADVYGKIQSIHRQTHIGSGPSHSVDTNKTLR